ncbi:hypothetical protein EYF80_025762 [Liparis tanakae]|uniref:Uncharacterized protein n=1 Tax=Liparis tanakae TaxID=230148 RepID=A0A4Z2HDW5_9TELE|nr:hypothetical protein EYF80_025762 [Liparis tanakae]
MAKRTVSSYFLPKPHDREKTNPQNESDSDYEETVLAKKGRKFSFRDERLRESPGSGVQSAVNSNNMRGTRRVLIRLALHD